LPSTIFTKEAKIEVSSRILPRLSKCYRCLFASGYQGSNNQNFMKENIPKISKKGGKKGGGAWGNEPNNNVKKA
jgi:hypothetical protein